MRTLPLAAAFGLATTVVLSARADIIQPSMDVGSASFAFIPAFGQSFTATAAEPQVSTVSFAWSQVNDISFFSDPSITVNLHEGEGYGGAILGTQTLAAIPFSTPDGAWVDFTFAAPISLTPGNMYSLEFVRNGGDFEFKGGYYFANDEYAGGSILDAAGNVGFFNDLTFRVLSVAPVPLPPAAWTGLGGLATAGAIGTLRRRRISTRM